MRLGITQEELAWRADIHRTYIADIERGGRNVTLRSVANLASALNVTVESLLATEIGRISGRPPEQIGDILLAVHNPADSDAILGAFKRARIANPVKVVRDGKEALDYAFCRGRYAKRHPEPLNLVLLDVGIPKVAATEVLDELRADATMRVVPVITLAGANQAAVVAECARHGANDSITKPVAFENISEILPQLKLMLAIIRSPDS